MNIFVGETKEEFPQKVLLNQWTEKTLIQEHLSTILDIKERGCDDFLECFTEEGTLYTVFGYQEGRNLLQYVQTEKLALPYRVVLLQNVLEVFLQYRHYSDMLQFCMLQYHNIVIQNHTIFFNYQLLLLPEEKEISCFAALEQTMQILFTTAERKSMPKLQIVADKCQKRLYTSLGEMIKELQETSGAVEKEKNIQAYIVQEKKDFRKRMVSMFSIVIIISAFYMAYNAYKKNTEDTFLYTTLESMGTVSIVSEQQSHREQTDTFVEVSQKQTPKITEKQEIQQQEIPQPQQSMQNNTYVVKAGDNLSRICLKVYQEIQYLQSLANYNNIKNINLIYPGQVLLIPPKEELTKSPVLTVLEQTPPLVTQQPADQQNEEEEMEGYILLTEEEDYS